MHLTALLALNLMQCQRHLQISRVKNISNVFELTGVAFRLAPHYDGLLVYSLYQDVLISEGHYGLALMMIPNSQALVHSLCRHSKGLVLLMCSALLYFLKCQLKV